ncbi:MAG: ABC transporter ATP-binding protein [Abitibacteriaceae bacterium]|nr:ABC transporter ATP-binding protein [Abditibacteriaceae bacterium]MBV9865606.1 ABC transporter ATP-binding protein [Abditibacteriaceae bacterium]
MQVQTINLTKSYPGNVTAVQPMNIQLADGIVGLLGPNGAGKTTFMRMLATLLEPSSGTALVDGNDIRYDKPAVRALLGYLPQDFGLYPSLSVVECLDYMGLLAGINKTKERRARIETMLERVNLTEFRHRKVGALSGGMKRRLGIAQAILHEPRLVIFDEPTAGLDPEERIRVRNLLSELGGDRIVILSTHIVADIASSAQTIAVMNRGSIIFHGEPAAMIERVRGKTWQVLTDDAGHDMLRKQYSVIEVQREATGVLVRLVGEQIDYPGVEPRDPTLEDAYVWLMSERTGESPRIEVPELIAPRQGQTSL